jgi:23S rRNA G2445 N2-methylase RlmL
VSARLVARSVRGLEWAVADEVRGRLPDASAITLAAREVSFRLPGLASPGLAGRLGLRLADDLFLAAGTVTGVGRTRDVPPAVAAGGARLDWATALASLKAVRELPGDPAFDVVASLLGRRNYNRFDLENAIGRALAPVLQGTFLARSAEGGLAGEPDLTVRVFVSEDAARLALRVARHPLHRRPYKQDTAPGTLHPPVAAAMARLAAGTAAGTVAQTMADPFCGDATIAIEAALAFPSGRVLAGDIDAARVGHARGNAARAGVSLALAELDAGALPWPAGSIDALVTNPPWNLAVDAGGLLRSSLEPFWRQVPRLLRPGGRACLIADAGLGLPGQLRERGYQVALAAQVRLAGRVSDLILCAPGGQGRPQVPAGLARWRRRAMAAGIVTEDGF